MLIMCPECGNKVSEFASNCVHCGCPMSMIVEITQNIQNADNILDELFDKLALSDQTKMIIKTWFRHDGCLITENNELSYIDNYTFKVNYYNENPNEAPSKLFEKYLKNTGKKSLPKDLEGFLKYKLEITKLQTSIDSLKSIGLDEEEIDIICSYIIRELYRDFDFSFDTKIRRPVI